MMEPLFGDNDETCDLRNEYEGSIASSHSLKSTLISKSSVESRKKHKTSSPRKVRFEDESSHPALPLSDFGDEVPGVDVKTSDANDPCHGQIYVQNVPELPEVKAESVQDFTTGVQQGYEETTISKRRAVFRSRRKKCASDTKLLLAIREGQGEGNLLMSPILNAKGEATRFASRSVVGPVFGSSTCNDWRARRTDLSDAENKKLIRIAAAFLLDYEALRPATLYHDPDRISYSHLFVRDIRFSRAWYATLICAALCLSVSSYFDISPQSSSDYYKSWEKTLQGIFNFVPAVLFYLDIAMMAFIRTPSSQSVGINTHQHLANAFAPRTSRSWYWAIPLALSLLIICIETAVNLSRGSRGIIWSNVLTPIAFFYLFQDARGALEALGKIAPQTAYILFVQLFLIFIFAVIACELYGLQFAASFGDLGLSFISMFECKFLRVLFSCSFKVSVDLIFNICPTF